MWYIFNLKSLEKLLAVKPEQYHTVQSIEFLRITDWLPLNVQQLTSLKQLLQQCSVTEVFLKNSPLFLLQDNSFQQFCDILLQCQNLEKIYIFEQTLTILSKKGLLELSAERLESLMQSLAHCKKLKNFSLEGNHVGDWDCDKLKTLGKGLLSFTSLQTIHLGKNEIYKLKSFSIQTLFGFLASPSIVELHLEGNNIGMMNFTCLKELGKACEKIVCLKLLNFNDNRLDELSLRGGFQAFFNSFRKSLIEIFFLADNGLGNANLSSGCFRVLGKVCGEFKNLQALYLEENKFNLLKDVCFQELNAGLLQSKTLRTIGGIHTFNAEHQEALEKIITRNQKSEKENQPVENKLEQEMLGQKRLFFTQDHSSHSSQKKACAMPLQPLNDFSNNTVNLTKKLKITDGTT